MTAVNVYVAVVLGREAVQVVSFPVTVMLESEQVMTSTDLFVVNVTIPPPLSEAGLDERKRTGCSGSCACLVYVAVAISLIKLFFTVIAFTVVVLLIVMASLYWVLFVVGSLPLMV